MDLFAGAGGIILSVGLALALVLNSAGKCLIGVGQFLTGLAALREARRQLQADNATPLARPAELDMP